MLTVDQAKAAFDYHPDTGILRLKVNVGKLKAGDVAGRPHGESRYVQVYFKRVTYPAHRLIWFIVHGVWPNTIDHIDGNRGNNRLSNLRDVTGTVNNQNVRSAAKTNKLGVLGVNKFGKRFMASISIDGKKKHLGLHDTPEQAHQAYLEAKRKHHAGCTI